jgi:hypothetical protein
MAMTAIHRLLDRRLDIRNSSTGDSNRQKGGHAHSVPRRFVQVIGLLADFGPIDGSDPHAFRAGIED